MNTFTQLVLGLVFLFGFQAFKFGPSRAHVSVARKFSNIAHTLHSFVASSSGRTWFTADAAEPPSRRLKSFQNAVSGATWLTTPADICHCAQEGTLSASELQAARELNDERLVTDVLFGPVPEWAQRDAAAPFPEGSLWLDSRVAEEDDEDEDADTFPVIVFLHPGLSVGSPLASKGLAYTVARVSGFKVLSLAYPLTPEHTPAEQASAVIDAVSALKKTHPRVFVVSASTGSVPLLYALQKGLKCDGVALFSPLALASRSSSAPHDVLDPQFLQCLTDGNKPLEMEFPKQLPPMFVQASANELLLDDAKALAKKMSGHKKFELDVVPHLPHMGALYWGWYAEATTSLQRAVAFLKKNQ